MYPRKPLTRLLAWFVGAALLVGTMGAPCAIDIDLPDDIDPGNGALCELPVDNVDPSRLVTVELVNTTGFEVDPGIYVDPELDVFASDELITDENLVVLDPPLQPGETVVLGYRCPCIGTMVSDYAWLLVSEEEVILSEDRPLLVFDREFICGDVIRFIFDVKADGFFYTDVEINGIPLED